MENNAVMCKIYFKANVLGYKRKRVCVFEMHYFSINVFIAMGMITNVKMLYQKLFVEYVTKNRKNSND